MLLAVSRACRRPPIRRQWAGLHRFLSNWEQVRTEAGESYYVHKVTKEATFVGAVKPKDWEEVVDEKTGQIYYWCRDTDETTPLGAKKPTWMDDQRAAQVVPVRPHAPAKVRQHGELVHPPPQRAGLLQYFIFGATFATIFGVVSRMF